MRWMKLHALVNLKFKAKSARLNVAIQSGARKDILVEFSESKHVWNTGIYVHKQNRTHPSQELTHPFKELCHPEILVCKRPPSIDSSIYETDVDGMASGMTIFRIPDRWFSLQGSGSHSDQDTSRHSSSSFTSSHAFFMVRTTWFASRIPGPPGSKGSYKS